MLKNSTLMVLSMVIRLGTSLVLFAFMAQAWGALMFGAFMYPFALAGLIVKIVDYGFALQTVRDIAREPETLDRVVGTSLAAKILLLVPTIAITALVSFVSDNNLAFHALLWLLLTEATLNSFATFLNLPFRAVGQFGRETSAVAVSNVILIAVVSLTLILGGGPIQVAAAFAISRLAYLAISCVSYRRLAGGWPVPRFGRGDVLSTVRSGFPFGVHIFVGTMYMQADTLLVQHFMGSQAVGIYQAGMRLLMGGVILGDAVNNVYLAELARLSRVRERLVGLATVLTRQMVALGSIAIAVLVGGNSWIVAVIFGEGYAELATVLPLFGAVLFLRYFGVSYGALLTVLDRQAARTVAVSAVLVVNIALNFVLIPQYGLIGALAASIISHAGLYGIYMKMAHAELGTVMIDRRTYVLLILACVLMAGSWVGGINDTSSWQSILALGFGVVATALGITRDELQTVIGVISRKRQGFGANLGELEKADAVTADSRTSRVSPNGI